MKSKKPSSARRNPPKKAAKAAKKCAVKTVKKAPPRPAKKASRPAAKKPPAKKPVAKAAPQKPAKKTAPQKPAAKSPAKKASAPKPSPKRAPAPVPAAKKNFSMSKKQLSTKAPSNARPSPSKPAPHAKESAAAKAEKNALSARLAELAKHARKRRDAQRARSSLLFTFEDAADAVNQRKSALKLFQPIDFEAVKQQQQRRQKALLPKIKSRNVKAASLDDILGFNPTKKETNPAQNAQGLSIDRVPNKFRRQYKALIEMRKRVIAGLAERSADTLKRSAKDDSGDLASYSSDSGTDTFDRDFAFNLVSSEHDLLFEIEQALRRMANGTYGICEITNKPIPADRLMAVPFTRYSLEGQRELEAMSGARKSYIADPTNLTETAEDETPPLAADDEDEGE